jgi:transcriptional regulator with XRE-family HTH domain
MSHNQRFTKIMALEGLSMTKLCREINYTLKNLSNYLNGSTKYPNGELVTGILNHYPHWNIRYWLLGEGKPFLGEAALQIVEDEAPPYGMENPVIKELTAQLSYMRNESQRKDKELKQLKKK